MGVKQFNVANLGSVGLLDPEQMGYQDSVEIIKDESFKIQKSFVKIGWYLKHIRDNQLYVEDGYANIYECAADQFGYSQSSVSRFINICEKFSKNQNSPELDTRYAGFDKSQMIEMLPLNPDELEKVTPDMTVSQIREIKADRKAKSSESHPEEVNVPGQTSIEKDFSEYMPSSTASNSTDSRSEEYAMSHNEIENPDQPEDASADSEKLHDESWLVEQYVKTMPHEAAKLFEVCRKEQSNTDRAKAIQKLIAPEGFHSTSCSEYDFSFYGFAKGVYFKIGCNSLHLTYAQLAKELTKYAISHDKVDGKKKLDVSESPSMKSDDSIKQPALPNLKNNEQRKEWLANYKVWGLWYTDDHIDVNYYKFDFPDGSRLVVAEYPQRYNYWNGQKWDECFYHLLEKSKKCYHGTYDEKYRHSTDSETYLVEFLKNLQKKG